MERWNGRVALVTGAAAGIGAGISRELVKHGLTVVGCDINEEMVKNLAEDLKLSPGNFHPVKCDLRKESDILAMFDYIRQKLGRIDICINNAGLSTNSPLLSGEISDWRRMLEVNVLALCICTRESVKLMCDQGIEEGQIINMCSDGVNRPPKPSNKRESTLLGFNFYFGTKFMVKALTEGLRNEVQSTDINIRVSNICPGLVETEFLSGILNPDKKRSLFKSVNILKPEDIADTIICILQSPPYLNIPEISVKAVPKRLHGHENAA